MPLLTLRRCDRACRLCRELPRSISGLSALTELSLQGNPRLALLPDELAALPALAHLSAADCGLCALPSCLRSAPALQSLSLYGNQLFQFPAVVLQVGGEGGRTQHALHVPRPAGGCCRV